MTLVYLKSHVHREEQKRTEEQIEKEKTTSKELEESIRKIRYITSNDFSLFESFVFVERNRREPRINWKGKRLDPYI